MVGSLYWFAPPAPFTYTKAWSLDSTGCTDSAYVISKLAHSSWLCIMIELAVFARLVSVCGCTFVIRSFARDSANGAPFVRGSLKSQIA